MTEIMTEDQNLAKYPYGYPAWRKDPVEHFLCHKHEKPTFYHRDSDMIVHDDETECK